MTLLPRRPIVDGPSDAALEAALRRQFSAEIEAQRDKLPDTGLMMLMSELESGGQHRARNARLVSWAEALALGAVATVAAFWFPDAATGIETLLPTAVAEAHGSAGPGLIGGLFGASLYFLRSLIRGN